MLANGKHGGFRSMVATVEQPAGSARDLFCVAIFHVRSYLPIFGSGGPDRGKPAGRRTWIIEGLCRFVKLACGFRWSMDAGAQAES
jgi:hypothetical protein